MDFARELDSVPWGTMHHAYGPADDVPKMIRAASSEDQAERDDAINALFGTIFHQGTVYEATAPAVPFIARVARMPRFSPLDRALMVALLAGIADGPSDIAMHVRNAKHAVAAEAPSLLADLAGVHRGIDWRLAQLASQADVAMTPRLAELFDALAVSTDNAALLAALTVAKARAADSVNAAMLEKAETIKHNFDEDEVAEIGAVTATSDEPDIRSRARRLANDLFEWGFGETGVAW